VKGRGATNDNTEDIRHPLSRVDLRYPAFEHAGRELLREPSSVCQAGWLMDDEFLARERVGVVNARDGDKIRCLIRQFIGSSKVVQNS